MKSLKDLVELLKSLPGGIIENSDKNEVVRFLFDCWDNLSGSNDTSMNIMKLHRCENLKYTHPNILEFEIERHGGTVMGSVYADVYCWRVDLLKQEAICDPYPKRKLVGIRDKPLKVEPIAQKIFNQIISGDKKSNLLEWKSENKVRVLIGEIIPATNNQTTAARRKRFRKKLEELLLDKGWSTTRVYNVYEKI
jgi:hypothetical protein